MLHKKCHHLTSIARLNLAKVPQVPLTNYKKLHLAHPVPPSRNVCPSTVVLITHKKTQRAIGIIGQKNTHLAKGSITILMIMDILRMK